MGYTRVCTPILYPILYWTKTAEQYQYPIPILYQISSHNQNHINQNSFAENGLKIGTNQLSLVRD